MTLTSRLAFLSLAIILPLIPFLTFAASFENPIGISGSSEAVITKITENFIDFLLGIIAAVALATIIYGGLRLILGATNESEMAKAKQIILWAVLGLLVVGAAAIVLRIVGFILGLRSSI